MSKRSSFTALRLVLAGFVCAAATKQKGTRKARWPARPRGRRPTRRPGVGCLPVSCLCVRASCSEAFARSHFTCTPGQTELFSAPGPPPPSLDWNSRVLALIHRAISCPPSTTTHRGSGLLAPAHTHVTYTDHVFLGKTTMGGGAGEIAVGTCSSSSSSSSATNSNNIASPMMPVVTLSQVRGAVGVGLERACLMMLCGLARRARRTGGAAARILGSRPGPYVRVHSRVPCDIQT